jgi:hypothetical protein
MKQQKIIKDNNGKLTMSIVSPEMQALLKRIGYYQKEEIDPEAKEEASSE